MNRNRFRVVVSLVACAVLTATFLPAVAVATDATGPTSVQPTTVPTQTDGPVEQNTSNDTARAAAIVENASQRYESIEDFTALQRTTSTYGNNTTTTTAEFAYRAPDDLRIEYVAPSPQAGTLIVSNGSATVVYNATNNTVRVFETPATGQSVGYLDSIVRTLETANTTYEGTETVAGEETYVLSAVPDSPLAGNITQTYYLDTETYLPVRQHVESNVTFNGTTVESESTTVLRNVSVDVGLTNETFNFEVPPSATVLESPLNTTTYDSLDAARENVSIAVREPADVPDGFDFEVATVTDLGNTTSVALQYANGSGATLTASFFPSESAPMSGNASVGETVTVDGQDGRYVSAGGYGSVQFQCGDLAYSVGGPFNRSRLVDIAASVSCDAPIDGSNDGGGDRFGDGLAVGTGPNATVGPPADLDDDGRYMDVDGDGTLTTDDVVALGDVLAAVNDGSLTLDEEQVAALDFTGDGELTFDDQFALLDAVEDDAR